MNFAAALSAVERGQTLDETDMAAAMRAIMNGAVADSDLAAFLTLLARRGETAAEMTGAARVLREHAAAIRAPKGAVDCCGTGGDNTGTYNISTAVAFVAASCGVPVAKHGNRASSSKSGAADVLEALGVNLDLPERKLEDALAAFNFAFLMAPRHNAAMKRVLPVRRALGFRTIFNLLGPLANPAGAKRQLMGVYDRKWLRPVAETLRNLGAESAWIVHGRDGLDEITVTGPTDIAILKDGDVTEMTLTPDDFGLATAPLESLRGGDAATNAAALRAVLEGARSPYRDIVLANTAAVLMLGGKAETLPAGVARAAAAIDGGGALDLLRRYTAFTRDGRTVE